MLIILQEELEAFPDFLEAPMLFIVQHFTHRGRIEDLVNDVHAFFKFVFVTHDGFRDRYFIDEELTFHEGGRRKPARIVAVEVVAEPASPSKNATHDDEEKKKRPS